MHSTSPSQMYFNFHVQTQQLLKRSNIHMCHVPSTTDRPNGVDYGCIPVEVECAARSKF